MNDEIKTRFESKFYVTPGCWIWVVGKEAQGYGRFSLKQVMKRTHRVSYEMYVGNIPSGMQVFHRCDNRICVNPEHLFLGTNLDNMVDKVKKGRQTKGTSSKSAKLTEQQVREIREDTRARSELAKEYGVGLTAVSNIKLQKKWRHV